MTLILRTFWIGLITGLTVVSSLVAAPLAVCYRVTELDYSNLRNPSTDVYDIYPFRLTDSGAFTGYIYHTNTPSSLLYYSPTIGFLDLGRWNDLGTRGFAINEAGQIAIKAEMGSLEKMLRYTPNVGYEELGTLGNDGLGTEHEVRFINILGSITGFSETAKGDLHAFRWSEERGIEDLGTLGGWLSKGLGINSAGWVSGTSTTLADEPHAFLARPGESMIDLGPGIAGDINNRGVIIGSAPNGLPELLYDGQRVRITPNFGIANYSVGCLNDHNLFRGTYWNSRLGIGFTAIVGSERHGIVDLNKLISTNSGWVLTEATGMNNKCQVVGRGWNGVRNTMFRLDPIIPPLSIQHTGTNIMLTWTEAFFPLQVEESATLEDVFWQPVGGISTNTLTLPMAHFSRFYRLAIPSPPSP